MTTTSQKAQRADISLKKNVTISIITRMMSMLMGFLTSIFITRYLGPELKGNLSYFLALGGTCWMLLDLGFHKSLSYMLSKDYNKLQSTYTFSLLLHVFDILLLSAVIFTFNRFFLNKIGLNNHYFLIMLILYTAIIHFGFIIRYIMLGIDRVLWMNLLKLLPSVLYLLLFFILKLFVPITDKLLYVLISLISAHIIITWFFTVMIAKGEKLKLDFNINFTEIGQNYKAGIRAFLSSFIIFLLIRADIFLIKHFEPLSELGLYSLAANFVTILQSFSNLVGSLMLPKFSSSSEDEQGNVIILKRVTLIFFIIISAVAIVFALVGKPIISLVYTSEFIKTYSVFLYLIPAVFFLSLGSLLNTFFWSKGFPAFTIVLPLISLIVNIVLNLFLIPAAGIYGAAIATSISYGLWLALLLYYFFNKNVVSSPSLLLWNKSDFVFLYDEGKKIIRRMLKK